MNTGQEPDAEQRALGERCRLHVGKVLGFVAAGDIDGAMDYLSGVEESDGLQMVTNIQDLMIVQGYALLPPEML